MKKIYSLLTILSIALFTNANPILVAPSNTVCLGAVVSLTIAGATDQCYSWDMGNGVNFTTSKNDTTYTYGWAGTFYVQVWGGPASCTGYTNQYNTSITVVDTSMGITTGIYSPICPYTMVKCTTYYSATKYRWYFGDGDSAITYNLLDNPEHYYTSPGNKTITLLAERPCGIFTSTTQVNITDTIHPIMYQWDANINTSDSAICPGAYANFNFNRLSSNYEVVTCHFGDGTSMQIFNISEQHSYSTLGWYYPFVVVTNSCGNSDTLHLSPIHVTNGVTSLPTVSPIDYSTSLSGSDSICINTPVYFYLSKYNYPNHYFTWQFGDGNTAPDTSYSIPHSYNGGSLYTPTLTIFNFCGASQSYTLTPIKVSTNKQVNITSTSSIYMVANNYPLQNNDTLCPKTPINFEVYGYPEYTFLWNFGDGGQLPGAQVQYSYLFTGTYPVSVTATNGCGDSETYSPSPNDMVHIGNGRKSDYNIYASLDTICRGDSIEFSFYLNNIQQANKFTWDFGDGSPQSLEHTIKHTYTATGNYTVTLFTENACNTKDTAYYSIAAVGNKKSEAIFTVQPNDDAIVNSCLGDSLHFLPNNISYPNYYWTFGDGTTSTSSNPKHVYTNYGSYEYDIYLIITNNCGISDTANYYDLYNQNVTVHPTPTVYAGKDTIIKIGTSIQLNGAASGQIGQYNYGYRLYNWTSSLGDSIPNNTSPNTLVTPSVSTTYYLEVTNVELGSGFNTSCPVIDSMRVTVVSNFSGHIFKNNGLDTVKSGVVFLFKYDLTNNVAMDLVDTTTIDSKGEYSFQNVPIDKYLLLAAPTTSTVYPMAVNTYYGDTMFWTGAQIYHHVGFDSLIDITCKVLQDPCPASSCPGRIEGFVLEGNAYGKMMGPGSPIGGAPTNLSKKPGGAIVVSTTSDTTQGPNEGKFIFEKLPFGVYGIHVDIAGMPIDVSMSGTTFTISPSDTNITNVNVYLDSNLIYMNLGTSVSSSTVSENRVTVYPNPAKEYITIEYTATEQEANETKRIQLVDVMGREQFSTAPFITTKGVNKITFGVNTLPNGIYFLYWNNTANPGNKTIISKVSIVK
ncbi:MAG: PKD domain-containing protein [Bacteroidetes bacterium]|nr:PKD domain-containing protein [Bacteroidota bacterium]